MGLVSAAVDTELQCRLGSRTRVHFYQPPFRISRRKSSKVGVRRTHMARLGVSKKKKSPRATELTQLKKELKRVTEQLEFRDHELAEAVEREAATGEILRVIASSPTDLQPALNAVAESAARLCEADDASIFRIDGDVFHRLARFGSIPIQVAVPTVSRDTVVGRAVVDRQTLHIHDLAAELETEFPGTKTRQQISGSRTVLATPLLREGVPIGVIFIRRLEVRPFTDKQIALLETFADQAVIAIENVRLFQELKESLDQQTATSEILGVIASSPTDLQPVLDAIVKSAARVCSADAATIRLVEGNVLRRVAHDGSIPASQTSELPIDRGSVTGRAVVDRQLIHIDDLMAVAATEFPESKTIAKRLDVRTVLSVPMVREDKLIGVITTWRREVRPFSDKQVALVKTFADQAVIAIENVRLFQEIQERTRELQLSLEEVGALSDVSRAVSSSLDLQHVLDAVAGHAVNLSKSDGCGIFEFNPIRHAFDVVASH